MSSMEAKVEILWNSLLLTWSYDYRVAGIHTFDKDGLAIGENLIERLNLETSWGTVTILETTDTSITFIHNGTRIILTDGAKYHFESIAEQSPESLEIIAEYMAVADNLGSTEAHEWLRDYYNPGDIAEPYS